LTIWNRRTAKWLGLLGALAVCVLLLLPVLTAWGPLFHWECETKGRIYSQHMMIPAVLVNSPFGGNATGDGYMAPDFPGGPGYPNRSGGYGEVDVNGSAGGPFFSVNLSLCRESSTVVLGPGYDSKCPSIYAVGFEQSWNSFRGVTGATLLGRGNTSDANEPTTVSFAAFAGSPLTPSWNNSFFRGTQSPLSTCGKGASSVHVVESGLPVMVTFDPSGLRISVPVTLPFQLLFNYWFPPDFGTWQIDNLSAPGGPGGGWAFSYTPC
jgi:hypothetical protein